MGPAAAFNQLERYRATAQRNGYQPQWVEAIYELLVHKKANIQLGFDVQFLYSCNKNKDMHCVLDVEELQALRR